MFKKKNVVKQAKLMSDDEDDSTATRATIKQSIPKKKTLLK